MDISQADITTLLKLTRLNNSDAERQELQGRLFALVQKRLREIAAAQMRNERPSYNLQPTAIVDDAFIELIVRKQQDWDNRNQFYAAACVVMKHDLQDNRRADAAIKRNPGKPFVAIDQTDVIQDHAADNPVDQLVKKEDAAKIADILGRFESGHSIPFRVFELHFIGTYPLSEVATILGFSHSTAKRHWKFAQAYLRRELKESESNDG